MATYKVIQDVEAEDKLVGPLSLRQFIYAAIAAFLLYLSFFAIAKGVPFLLLFFVPPALFTGFLAVPWHSDQPTEVWALAKLRFIVRSRKRLWDQSGAKELVTITVPKKIERNLTNGLSEREVRSRLHALANTIDSRGWAVKNVNVNLSTTQQVTTQDSDRLVDGSTLPQEVSSLDVNAADDMLDTQANPVARQFDTMIQNAASSQRQQLIQQMQSPDPAPVATKQDAPSSNAQAAQDDYWFMQQPGPTPTAGQATFTNSAVVAPGAQDVPAIAPQAATPTAEEEALVEQFKSENSTDTIANDHLKHIKTPAQIAADEAAEAAEKARKAQVTSDKQAAIINLASNDDLDVATIARQARKDTTGDDGEVVISLR
ncbi:PrgI family protein [Candidatus Saccharibacteria bacterium]|nr:PrgI family protein [Candidatus Saccharibacteria bacterium]